LRRMPALGTSLVVGAAALVGLPGTAGFAGEWLLFMSLFRGSLELTGPARLVMLLGVVAAAFAAGAALACFVRFLGVGLLGRARSREAAEVASSGSPWLAIPVAVLAGLCLALVALLRPLLEWLAPAVEQLAPGAPAAALQPLVGPLPWLAGVLLGGAAAVAL